MLLTQLIPRQVPGLLEHMVFYMVTPIPRRLKLLNGVLVPVALQVHAVLWVFLVNRLN